MEKFTSSQAKKKYSISRFLWLLLILTLSIFILALVVFILRLTGRLDFGQMVISNIAKTPASISIPATPTRLNITSATSEVSKFQATGTVTLSPTPMTFIETNQAINNQNGLGFTEIGEGYLILAINEGIYSHLFTFIPQKQLFTRISSGTWNDINPAASPDGRKIAFASDRNGYWDLYLLELTTGEIQQLTSTPAFDGSPSWSPDGNWLIFESYHTDPLTGNANLELLILDITLSNPQAQTPIQLTNRPSTEFSPVWSPNGRQIAFVTLQNGEKDIWLADLDNVENRFQNLSSINPNPDTHPAWSPDGKQLLWSTNIDGMDCLFLGKPSEQGYTPQYIGSGNWSVWDSSGRIIFTTIQTPYNIYLTGFNVQNNRLVLAPINLAGEVNGLTWNSQKYPLSLPSTIQNAAKETEIPEWRVALLPRAIEDIPRQQVVPLGDVNAPFSFLQDLVDESFHALRNDVVSKLGWDYLSSLENAYVPLTSPLFPGMLNDWLYTGRAFAASSAPMNAGWMIVMRENFGSATYWRVYLRTRYQDGSQGTPLHDLPWDFNQRMKGDPKHYEQGGGLMKTAPAGYWIDFTKLAASYGWQRMPALSSWIFAFPASRINEFVYSDGLDWHSAMLEIYPPEAIVTVTPPPPPSSTPTKTPIPSQTPTPTKTPIPSLTPTINLSVVRSSTSTNQIEKATATTTMTEQP